MKYCQNKNCKGCKKPKKMYDQPPETIFGFPIIIDTSLKPGEWYLKQNPNA